MEARRKPAYSQLELIFKSLLEEDYLVELINAGQEAIENNLESGQAYKKGVMEFHENLLRLMGRGGGQ